MKALSIRCGLLCTAALLLAATPLWAQTDTTPPQLVSLSVTPGSVNVTSAQATLVFTARATDDLAGIGTGFGFQLSLKSPSGVQFASAIATGGPSGLLLDRTATINVIIPRFAEPGPWSIQLALVDGLGNFNVLTPATLSGLGMPSTVTVVDATPDVAAPALSALTMTASSVDVSTADATVSFDMTLADDVAGVRGTASTFSDFVVTSPSGAQSRFAVFNATTGIHLISGTANAGVWRGSFVMSRFSEPGVWKVSSVRLIDLGGNIRLYTAAELATLLGSSGQLVVTSSPADVAPPVITSVAITPAVIDSSSGAQTVQLRLGVVDDLSGVSFSSDVTGLSQSFVPGLASPSGSQFRSATPPPFPTTVLTAGTPTNGIWLFNISFPQFSEAGTWSLRIQLKDGTRNILSMSTADLQAIGFPTTLEVLRPSLTADGVLGPDGGTVADQTFGARAQVTAPQGLLTSAASVAIDVLPTPQGIVPLAGFTAGTRFVGIVFTPSPVFPLAAPGLTLVLPLGLTRLPGTALTLFRVDSVTGSLVPAIGVDGELVRGVVNADGLSATFTGVAQTGTLIALNPTGVLGDTNFDEVVDCSDALIVKASFGKRGGQPGFDQRADVNRDNVVNVIDLSIVTRQLPAGTICK